MASTIQIFGTKKCKDTQKAIRYFKERSIKTQFIDLNEKGMSKGELESVIYKIHVEQLINTEGKQYKLRNLAFMTYEIETELLEDPLLLKTPITRFGKLAVLGINKEEWDKWIIMSKK